MTNRQALIERAARIIAQNHNCYTIEDWSIEIGRTTEGNIITEGEQEYYDNMNGRAWKRFSNEVQHKAISKYQLKQMPPPQRRERVIFRDPSSIWEEFKR